MKRVVVIVIKYLMRNMKRITSDEKYMRLALKEAQKAYEKGEVPVGCIIVYNDKIIARSHNKRQNNKSVIGHAEIIAIEKACKKLGTWVLEDTTMYVTLEPCLMCAGAILNARIKKVIYATAEPKFGVLGSLMNVYDIAKFNHQVEVKNGLLQEEASKMLKEFFKKLRLKKDVTNN